MKDHAPMGITTPRSLARRKITGNAAPIAAGVAAGIALVVACGEMNIEPGGRADASPNDCAAWQVAHLENIPTSGVDTPTDIPSGWEPFSAFGGAFGGTANFYVRRCRP
jgi:hypothetical protein